MAIIDSLTTVAILRGRGPLDAAEVARRSWTAGVDLVEVSIRDESDWGVLEAVAASSDGSPVGAGTITTPHAATRAIRTGATVLISPGIDLETMRAASEAGVPLIPGVMTPTELHTALRAGARLCKLFPAGFLGVDYVRAVRGPFPDAPLIAVGGVDDGNARAFIAAGAQGVAFGGSLDRVLSLPDPVGFIESLRAERGPDRSRT